MCCSLSTTKFTLFIQVTVVLCYFATFSHFAHASTTRFRLRIVSNEERSTDSEHDYHIENESSKTYIDSDSDFAPSASIFNRQKATAQPTAQTTQFIMVPGLNGQFVSPAQVQQSSPIIQPIVIQATAPPTLRLPQVSLNLLAPSGGQVGLGLGGQSAPVINQGFTGINPALVMPFLGAGFGGGGGRRGRGRGRGRGRRRRPGVGAARLRQAAMISALRQAQLQQQPQPQMQVLQPIILQQPASSTAAPIRERQVEQVQVVQPVVQPIIAQPISMPVPIESPSTSLRQQLSHIAEPPPPPSYHRVVPSYSRPYSSSSYYGYTANRSYYRTPGGGIVNQIVIQPPANQGKGLLSKTRKKMRQKVAKKLIKMLDE